MTRRLVAQTCGNFLENVAQRRRRTDSRRHRERQPVSLRGAAIFTVVRILAEDHDFDLVRTGEAQCAKYVGGIDRLARGALAVDETAQRFVRVALDERSQMGSPCRRQRVELGFEGGR